MYAWLKPSCLKSCPLLAHVNKSNGFGVIFQVILGFIFTKLEYSVLVLPRFGYPTDQTLAPW